MFALVSVGVLAGFVLARRRYSTRMRRLGKHVLVRVADAPVFVPMVVAPLGNLSSEPKLHLWFSSDGSTWKPARTGPITIRDGGEWVAFPPLAPSGAADVRVEVCLEGVVGHAVFSGMRADMLWWPRCVADALKSAFSKSSE